MTEQELDVKLKEMADRFNKTRPKTELFYAFELMANAGKCKEEEMSVELDLNLEEEAQRLEDYLHDSLYVLEGITEKIKEYSPQIDRSIGEALVIDDSVMFVAHNKKTGKTTKFELKDIAKEYCSGFFIDYEDSKTGDIFADDVQIMLIKK